MKLEDDEWVVVIALLAVAGTYLFIGISLIIEILHTEPIVY